VSNLTEFIDRHAEQDSRDEEFDRADRNGQHSEPPLRATTKPPLAAGQMRPEELRVLAASLRDAAHKLERVAVKVRDQVDVAAANRDRVTVRRQIAGLQAELGYVAAQIHDAGEDLLR
jgi:hypothetical protein